MNHPYITIEEVELKEMNQRKRGALLNSLAGFRTAVMVGTISQRGVFNLSIFNSLIHLGADPALWGLVLRPNPLERDTYRNIEHYKSYTLNYLHVDDREKAHQCSAKYDSSISEFDPCGLTPELIKGCVAPFVRTALVKIQMELVSVIPVPLNQTSIMIGKPKAIYMKSELLGADGFVNLAEHGVLGCAGLDAYLEAHLLDRFEYAQPGKAILKKEINP
jgi:flavin reductase (DIM6/NTAB) family NADH-FMN oxidoreductase RutF